jgi:hypothetical protein
MIEFGIVKLLKDFRSLLLVIPHVLTILVESNLEGIFQRPRLLKLRKSWNLCILILRVPLGWNPWEVQGIM